MRPRTLSDVEIQRARETIANQASTMPADGDLSMEGAWKRAGGVRTVNGALIHEVAAGPLFRTEPPSQGPIGRR